MDGPDESLDRSLRLLVLEQFLRHSRAPVLEELSTATNRSPAAVLESLRRLEAAHHLKLVDGTPHILMAFPFSGVATSYRANLRDGRSYFANCAWDAIAFHPMLGEPIGVDSFCHHCAGTIQFEVVDGRGVPGRTRVPLLYFGRPAAAWWADIVRTCGTSMVYFADRTHFDAWVARSGSVPGAVLSVEQTAQISVPIYERKLRADYARPPAAMIEAAFRHAGLTGEFWTLPP